MSQIYVGENQRRNKKWTIQKNWQHLVHKTENEDKESKVKTKITQHRELK